MLSKKKWYAVHLWMENLPDNLRSIRRNTINKNFERKIINTSNHRMSVHKRFRNYEKVTVLWMTSSGMLTSQFAALRFLFSTNLTVNWKQPLPDLSLIISLSEGEISLGLLILCWEKFLVVNRETEEYNNDRLNCFSMFASVHLRFNEV